MSFILIDRRKVGRGKSVPNRQRLLRRIKSFIKSATPQNIGQGGVTGSGTGAQTGSPVKIAGSALEEPHFLYDDDGDIDIIFLGNEEYNRGDEIEFPEEDGGAGTAGGHGDNGEDDFIVNVARDEFLELYYEDCELPNLVNERYTEKLDNKLQRAGYTNSGSPAQLSIIRTYKQSLARQYAMAEPLLEEKERLEQELSKLIQTPTNVERVNQIKLRLEEIENLLSVAYNFDTSDLRYSKKEAKPLKTTDAVLFMLMDISGSMGEFMKLTARRWFALFYGFIKRRYPGTELVFIAHTDEAFEMSENDFFSTRINGGTSASSALELANKIIKERYDPNHTNIYVSHASDGDNAFDDNESVLNEMTGEGNLMGKIQLFSYVEVGGDRGGFGSLMSSSGSSARTDSGLWTSFQKVRQTAPKGEQKVILSLLPSPDDCYPVFKKVFRKRR